MVMQEMIESGKIINNIIDIGWPGVIFLIISAIFGFIGLLRNKKEGNIASKVRTRKEQIDAQAKLPLENIKNEENLERAEAELESYLKGEVDE